MPQGRGPTSTEPATLLVAVSIVNTWWPRPVLTNSLLASDESSTAIGLIVPGLPSDIVWIIFCFGDVDNHDGSVVLGIDIGLGAIRQKRDRARPVSDFDGLEDLTRHRIEHRKSACFFGSDINTFSIGSSLHPFRLLSYLG